MIQDIDERNDTVDAEADVCIVGAGCAGMTLAGKLVDAGHRVVLLESGGMDQANEIDQLMEGECVGFPYYPLDEARLRFLGGTTNIWGGRCAFFDEIDFEPRSWVPHSGWPIRFRDLADYYRQAQTLLELAVVPPGDALWESHGLRRPPFDPDVISTRFWQFDTMADRFAAARSADLLASQRLLVLLHANVTQIRATPVGDSIREVTFASLSGARGSARARVIVLAAGGIENPRLLLASNDVQKNGLGNGTDLVGRFFMEHPHARGGRIDTNDPLKLLKLLPRSYRRNGYTYAALARPADALQANQGLLNTSFTLSARQHPGDEMVIAKKLLARLKHDFRASRTNRFLWHQFRRTLRVSKERYAPWWDDRQIRHGRYGLYAVVRAEQSPNPDSRITLSRVRDPLGVPRPTLDWRFQAIDKHSVAGTMRALAAELTRLGLGRVEPADWLCDPAQSWQTDPLISNHAVGGYHHMGTTRMGTSTATGVVDADSRVFGIRNLYVAGSSVFTTAGWANPTLTLLALTLRLADHISLQLGNRKL